jgi:uroporphyrin-3 C-methyltransferase
MNEVNLDKNKTVKNTSPKIKLGTIFLFLKSGLQVIVVFALIGLIYFIWQQQKLIDEIVVRQNQALTESENIARQLLSFQQDFENLNNAEASSEILFSQQNARVDRLNEELVSLRLGMNANQASGIWQLAQAASLLRLAQQYLEFTQDLPVALSLYQNSRAILTQINDPALDRITSLLASDIQNLSRAQRIDTEGFYMRLSDISLQLESVSLGMNIEPSTAFLEGDIGGEVEGGGFFNNVREFLSRYFTVRRLDTPLDMPLSNQQISFLRQNMLIQIEQAKLALLQGRQSIYQDSISNVVRLAQQNIPEQDQQKTFILRSLRELQEETILLEFPPLSESLVLLENIMSDIPGDSRN